MFQFLYRCHVCNSLLRNTVSHTKLSKLIINLHCRFHVSSCTGLLIIANIQRALPLSCHFAFYKNIAFPETVGCICSSIIHRSLFQNYTFHFKVTHLRNHRFLSSRKLKCMALSYPIMAHFTY